ncbi:hypothetical protein ACFYRN_35380 [Streptomyces sp. NPDC005227]|uniref:hypothetical protein n=1 Tax=unclassified Streptomyces TaxID=2593676 RepID=UPI0036CA41AC
MQELLPTCQDRTDDLDPAQSGAATMTRPAATAPVEARQQPSSASLHEASADTVMHQAVGIVMALGRLPAYKSRTVLTEVSQRTNVTPLRIAGLLTSWASCGELNLGIRIALEEAIRAQRRAARPTGPAAD